MKLILIILLTTVGLFGCNCEKQLQRIARRCPIERTVTVQDTFISEAFQTDTVFVLSPAMVACGGDTVFVTDTFLVEKERVKVRVIREVDTLRVNVELPADTVVKTIEVEVPPAVCTRKHRNALFDALMVFGVIAALGAVTLISRKLC